MSTSANIIRRSSERTVYAQPRGLVSGRPAYRSAHALRFNGAPVRAMRTAGARSADHEKSTRLSLLATGADQCPEAAHGPGNAAPTATWLSRAVDPTFYFLTPPVCKERGSRPFRTDSRAAASRRRATTSTSTVVVKPALGDRCDVPGNVAGLSRRVLSMPAGEERNALGSSPRIAANARQVFVARVRAENDRAPATPAMAGGPAHQIEVA
jgi:hypothetical protein